MKVLFAGPSLADELERVKQSHGDIDVRGPAACGDLAQAVQDGATAIGIVDGYFEQTRSVWHKEVLFALSQGVTVAGAASMGALRAAECEAFGMIAIGDIARKYLTGILVDDSDVALVHAPQDLNYLPLSEPRVNIIATIDALMELELVSANEGRCAKAIAQRMFYTELNLRAVFARLPASDSSRIEELIRLAEAHYVNAKKKDALELVNWLSAIEVDTVKVERDWAFHATSQWLETSNDMAARHSVK